MSVSKIQTVWKLMSEQSFVCPDSNSEELICVICKQLMVNAVVSTGCGCQYCYGCIHEHIDTGNSYCPGNKEFCNDECLVLDINAFRNTSLNKRILKLKVNCPNPLCSDTVELMRMDEHLRLCDKSSMECPFASIGCDKRVVEKDIVGAHLHCNEVEHTKLLMDLIEALKNEIIDLKDDFAKCKVEIVSLKEDSLNKERKIIALEERCQQSIIEIEKKVMADDREMNITHLVSYMKDYCRKMDREIEKIHEELNCKKREISNLEMEITKVKKEMQTLSTRLLGSMERDLVEQRQQIIVMKNENEKLTTNILSKLNDVTNNNVNDLERRIIYFLKWNQLCPTVKEDFMWKIDAISTKKDTDLYSESFYSNNYRLCLYTFIGSSSRNIYLYCYIMKGVHDDELQWPMKGTITINIVDQDSLRPFKSDTFETAFRKPTRSKGCRVGTSSFLRLSLIGSASSVVVNDSMVVSCEISIQ